MAEKIRKKEVIVQFSLKPTRLLDGRNSRACPTLFIITRNLQTHVLTIRNFIYDPVYDTVYSGEDCFNLGSKLDNQSFNNEREIIYNMLELAEIQQGNFSDFTLKKFKKLLLLYCRSEFEDPDDQKDIDEQKEDD